MVVDIGSFIPLVTILGAAAAPTIAAIWAERKRAKDARRAQESSDIAAMKVAEVRNTLVATASSQSAQLHTIEHLVNDQLTQAVNRFEGAMKEIATLKGEVKRLKDQLD
jgi:hypothetical protein